MSTETLTQRTNGATEEHQRPTYRPVVDVRDTGKTIEMFVEMPGVDESSVDVTVDKNVLTIHGRVEPPVFEGMRAVHTEYGVGDYQRSFTLAEDIDRDAVDASISHGVLTLKLARREDAGMKRIAIKAG